MDTALLIIRLAVGLLLAGHGSQKLFGWFGGQGFHALAAWLGSIGMRPARAWALVASLNEFIGGLLFALGLFTPLGSLGIAASMLVAISKVHWPKLWNQQGGFELPFVYLAIVVAVGIAGPGAISLDRVLGTSLPRAVSVAGVIAVLVGWIVALVISATHTAQTARSAS